MPVRKDRDSWTAEEDAWLREQAHRGIPVPKQHRNWPATFPPRTLGAIRCYRAANGITTTPNPDLPQSGVPQPPAPEEVQKVNVREDGDTMHVEAVGREVKTFEELIARCKIDTRVWEMGKPQTRVWHTSVKGADGKIRQVQNFQLATTFQRKAGPNTKEQVEALIAGAFAKRTDVPRKSPSKSPRKSDLMQAVVIADPHLAKYAFSGETGWQDYDLSIASRLVDTAARELMDWGDTHKPAHRYIFLLGDVLHYDTPHGTTTGGTPQDRDTRLSRMLEEAASVLCGIVERSASVPTTVVSVAGNHDRVLSVAMQQILAAYFRKDKAVAVDTSATHRKYVEWGHCLIGLTHGDTARKRLPSLMQVERKEAWGRSRVREWHHGHFHREASTTTEGGVTIREHLSLSPPDSWHAVEGYVGAPRGMDSLLYDARGFLRGTWRSPVLDG